MLAEAAGYAWRAISIPRESWRPALDAWDDFMMGGNWRPVMTAEVERLRAELPSAPSRAAQATMRHAAGLLDAVEKSVKKPPSIREWWTGEQSLLASFQVHEAEAELAATLPDEIALARLPQALADARRDIGNDDNVAVREATSLYFETYAGGSSAARPPHRQAPQVLSQLLQSRYDAVDTRQARSLTFRKAAMRTTAVILVSLLAVVAVAAGAQLHLSPEGRSVTAFDLSVSLADGVVRHHLRPHRRAHFGNSSARAARGIT